MSATQLSPTGLIVHCFYEKKDGQWQAFSLQFGLAAQADSFEEARRKLESMVRSYVYDALAGEDRDHAQELMSRKATRAVYVKYYSFMATSFLRHLLGAGSNGSNNGIYDQPMPLMPA